MHRRFHFQVPLSNSHTLLEITETLQDPNEIIHIHSQGASSLIEVLMITAGTLRENIEIENETHLGNEIGEKYESTKRIVGKTIDKQPDPHSLLRESVTKIMAEMISGILCNTEGGISMVATQTGQSSSPRLF